MRALKIVSISLVILLIVVSFSGIVTVFPTVLPAAGQSSNALSYQSGQFVGSKNSDVYHYPSCYHVKAIKSENLVYFNSVQDACAHGYRPCKDCNPPACPVPTPTPTPPKPTSTPVPTASKSKASVTPTTSPSAGSYSATSVPQASATEIVGSASASAKGSTPGFEAIFAIIGLLAVGYVIMRRREK